MQNVVRQQLGTLADQLQNQTMLVAVSGGVDSHVLLHLLHQLQPDYGYQLQVATFDHGLRGEASRADADFVTGLAAEYGWPCHLGHGDVAALAAEHTLNLEAAARQARYTFLAQIALATDATTIALAHHRDDHIETTLMHLIRGTGLAGLRGLSPLSPLTESHLGWDAPDEALDALEGVQLLRPLVGISRAEIEAYAEAHQLTYRHDATNDDTRYLRNHLRHQIIPQLEALNPNFREAITRLTTIIQGDYQIIEQAVTTTAANLVEWGETVPIPPDDEGGEVAYVERPAFLAQPAGMQRQLLRYIISDLAPDLHDLTYQQIEIARALIAKGETGTQHHLPADLTLLIGYDEFMIYYGGQLPFPRHIPYLTDKQVVPLDAESDHIINDTMRFYSYWVPQAHTQDLARPDPLEATLVIPPDAILNLRTRRAGDTFRPFGMGGKHQKLADTFTNLKVPRTMRDRVPLLTVNDEIAWFVAPTIHGLQGRIGDPFAVRGTPTDALRVRWEPLKPDRP